MRTWFHKHPNVAVVLIGIASLHVLVMLAINVSGGRWGWAAVNVVGFTFDAYWLNYWWDRT